MRQNGIEEAILAFFADRFGVAVPSPETDLIGAGILDSLMFVDLVMYIEERFGVPIGFEDLEIHNFATVASMAEFVAARR